MATASADDSARRKLFGILTRRERWGLSWRGWLAAGLGVLTAGGLVFWRVYPFLAVTHRVDTNVLVVEGWMDTYAFPLAAREFTSGRYAWVFVTGGPVVGNGGYTGDYQTEAHVGEGRLKDAGVPNDLVQMVPSRVWNRNRTYYSAVALRDWFRDHNLRVQSFNVVTEGCHARRTWLLFQAAFGKDVHVGVISVSNPDYNTSHWWRYSDGVREVSSETLAYLYAKLLFWPPKVGETGAGQK